MSSWRRKSRSSAHWRCTWRCDRASMPSGPTRWSPSTPEAQAHGRLGPVGPKLLQHGLHERAIDRLVEIDGAFDETLLGVEGEIICETCFVCPSVRIHAGRSDQFVDVPALDRRRLGQDGNDIVRVRSVEPAVFERAVIKAHRAHAGAHEPPGGIGLLEYE